MILVDTNVLVAYHNVRDSCHDAAKSIFESIDTGKYGAALISDYVFDEAVTVCALRVGKKAATELGNALLVSFEMVKITEHLFLRAWRLFAEDNDFSFTDCVNCAVVEELDIDFLASFDKEFKKVKSIQIVDE